MFLFYVNPILIAAAVIPAIVLLRFVYKEDRLDKESPGLLLSLVIFGILSTFAAIVTEQIGEAILGILLPQSSTAYNALLYFVVVALSEEGFKYLLLKKRTWYLGEFNCQFDGIVYAVFVALGFALWENISYVLMYGLGTAAIRAVTAVPGQKLPLQIRQIRDFVNKCSDLFHVHSLINAFNSLTAILVLCLEQEVIIIDFSSPLLECGGGKTEDPHIPLCRISQYLTHHFLICLGQQTASAVKDRSYTTLFLCRVIKESPISIMAVKIAKQCICRKHIPKMIL